MISSSNIPAVFRCCISKHSFKCHLSVWPTRYFKGNWHNGQNSNPWDSGLVIVVGWFPPPGLYFRLVFDDDDVRLLCSRSTVFSRLDEGLNTSSKDDSSLGAISPEKTILINKSTQIFHYDLILIEAKTFLAPNEWPICKFIQFNFHVNSTNSPRIAYVVVRSS